MFIGHERINLATTPLMAEEPVFQEQKTGRAIFIQALYGKLDISPNFTLFVAIGYDQLTEVACRVTAI